MVVSRYCITFLLETQIYQEDILDKRFEIGRKMYNAILSKVYKRYQCMIETKAYRQLIKQIEDTDKKLRKPLYKQLEDMHKDYRLNEYSLHKDIQEMQHHFSDNIDAFTAQKIATRVWKAMKDLLFGEGEKVHFKRFGELKSLEGKSNKTGIKFKDNHLVFNGLNIPVKIDPNNTYEMRALQDKICFCRIKRRFIKGRYKYYIQIVFKGIPPDKHNKDGEKKRTVGKGIVGLDIGTQTIAISSNEAVNIFELADRVQNIENQKRRLLRYMDRSKRVNNPDNFNKDGTIKHSNKLYWNKSNRYIKAQSKLKELYRRQADIREYQHQQMSNFIISLGDTVYVEKMSFKGLSRRSKKTEKNEKGRFKRKKRFGKSLANKAPAKLLTLLDNKLKSLGSKLIKINTREVKASQYNHLNGEYNKKKLSQRYNNLDGVRVQRDLYSAFLIQHVNEDLKSINRELCYKDFQKFLDLHNIEIERLSNSDISRALKNVI